MKFLRTLLPTGLASRFTLLLLASLVSANVIAAYLLAREGSNLDRAVRMMRDMGRLVSLVSTLEGLDKDTADSIMKSTSTGYSRFSLGPAPLGNEHNDLFDDTEEDIARELPNHEIRVFSGYPASGATSIPPLMMISVKLNGGHYKGAWLNSVIYPLAPVQAWWQKIGFFVPLVVSLIVSVGVGYVFIRRMTSPLNQLAEAARAAGRGDRMARVTEAGAGELRDAAVAFNSMQQRIADFDNTRQRLLAAIAHDLRTPITSLRVRAEMLSDTETQTAMIRTLEDMTIMSEDLLRYANGIWSGEDLREADLDALVACVCGDKGATFIPGPPLPTRIRVVAVSRAVSNIVDNAMRYAGGATATLVRDGNEAVIRVEDDGPGIPPDRLDAVQEPFVRGEQSRSAATGGVGLGLAIAKSVMIDHGGSLTLTNRPKSGLRATLRLPLGQAGAI